MNDILNNGYYPDIAKYYIQSLSLFEIKGMLSYEDCKKICEEILIDYSGDFENNFEIFSEYRLFISKWENQNN